MTDFRDCLWWDVSSEDYYASTLPGYSYLSRLLSDRDPPKKTTGDFGNAVHVAVLQPELFGSLVVIRPTDLDMPAANTDLRKIVEAIAEGTMSADDMAVRPDDCKGGSKAAKERRAAWEASQPEGFREWKEEDRERADKCASWLKSSRGKYVLTDEQHHLCLALSVGVTEHPATQKLWGHPKSRPEQAVRGTDSVTGITCRTRLDHFIGGRGAALSTDLKTADDPDPDVFLDSVFDYGYDLQAALCCDMVEAIQEIGMCPAFNWLVVGNRLPVRIAWVQCSDEILEMGRRRLRAALTVERAMRDRQWQRAPRWYEGRATTIGAAKRYHVDLVEKHEMLAKACSERAGR